MNQSETEKQTQNLCEDIREIDDYRIVDSYSFTGNSTGLGSYVDMLSLVIVECEDVSNLLSFSTKRCSHLGCALKWNKAEHSWDCACHGSRFDENGKVLDNPANAE